MGLQAALVSCFHAGRCHCHLPGVACTRIFPSGALAVAAKTANGTAPFMLHDTAALGTGPLDQRHFLQNGFIAVVRHMGVNRFGYGIGARQNFVFTESGRRMAGNAL